MKDEVRAALPFPKPLYRREGKAVVAEMFPDQASVAASPYQWWPTATECKRYEARCAELEAKLKRERAAALARMQEVGGQ